MSVGFRVWLSLYRAQIQLAADAHGLEAVQLASVVAQESNGGFGLIPGAGVIYHPRFLYRYEPAFWTHYLAGKPEWAPPPGAELEPALDGWKRRVSASYGICQLMYPTAVGLLGGERIEPERLFDPALSLDLSARLLRRHLDQGYTWRGALAAYNTGRNRPEATLYDDEVLAKEQALRDGLAFA